MANGKFRAVGTAVSGSTITTLSPVVPATARVGDLLVMYVTVAASSSAFTLSGWSFSAPNPSASGTSVVTVMGTKRCASGDINAAQAVTWTTSGTAAAAIAAYSGIDGTTPVDVSATGSSTTTTVKYGSLTAYIDNLNVAAAGINSAKTAGTSLSGYTNRLDNTTKQGLDIFDGLAALAHAASAPTSTGGTTANNAGFQAALRQAQTPQLRGFVDEASKTTGQTAATSSATEIGDVTLAVVRVSTASTITTPTGWTQILNTTFNSGANQYAVYSKKATAAGAETVTWTFTGGGTLVVHYHAWSGCDDAAAVDVSGSQSNASSTSVTAPTVTETSTRDVLIFCGFAPATGTWTVPTGMTAITATATKNTFSAYEGQGTAVATGTRAGTLAVGQVNAGALIALKPPSSQPLVQNWATAGATGTSTTLSVPTGVVDGQLLVAAFRWASAVTAITPPAGWTEVFSDTAGTPVLKVYSRVAASEPGSYNWSWTTSSVHQEGMVNVGGGVQVDTTAVARTNTAASATVNFPSVTPVAGPNLVLYVALSTASTISTGIAGSEIVANASNFGVAYAVQGAPAAIPTHTMTLAGAVNNTGLVIPVTAGAIVSPTTATGAGSAVQTGFRTHAQQRVAFASTRGPYANGRCGPFYLSGTGATYAVLVPAGVISDGSFEGIIEVYKTTTPNTASSWAVTGLQDFPQLTSSLSEADVFAVSIQMIDAVLVGTTIHIVAAIQSTAGSGSSNGSSNYGHHIAYLKYDTSTDTLTTVATSKLNSSGPGNPVWVGIGVRSNGDTVVVAGDDGFGWTNYYVVASGGSTFGGAVSVTNSASEVRSLLIDESDRVLVAVQTSSNIQTLYVFSSVDAALSNQQIGPSGNGTVNRTVGMPCLYGTGGSKTMAWAQGTWASTSDNHVGTVEAAQANTPSLSTLNGLSDDATDGGVPNGSATMFVALADPSSSTKRHVVWITNPSESHVRYINLISKDGSSSWSTLATLDAGTHAWDWLNAQASSGFIRVLVGVRNGNGSGTPFGTGTVTYFERALAQSATLADGAAAADSLTRVAAPARTLTDAAAAADALTRAPVAFRTLADGSAAADALARGTLIQSRVVADGAAAADSVARGAVEARTLSDGAASSDSLVRGTLVQSRTVADGAAGSDALSRGSVVAARTLSDGAAAADALARAVRDSRTLTDNAAAADALTRGPSVQARTPADGAAAADALSRGGVAARSLTDGAAAADALTRSPASARTLVDTAAALDALARGNLIQARSVADGAAAADALTRTSGIARSLGDNAAAVDTLTRGTVAATRTLSDGAAAADALTRAVAQARTLADGAAAVDALARGTLVLARTLADAAAAADSLTRANAQARSLTDGAAATDGLTRAATQTRTLADNAAAGDTLTRGTLVETRTLADGVASSDSLSRATAYARTLADGAAAADSLSASVVHPGIARTLSDDAAAADALTRLVVQARSLADAAAAADTLARGALVAARTLSDNAAAADALTRSVAATRTLADGAAAVDTLTRVDAQSRTLSDNAAAVDTVSRAGAAARTLTDNAAAVDALTRVAAAARTLADTAAAADVLVAVKGPTRPLADNAAAADNLTRGAVVETRTVADAAAASDSLSRTQSQNRTAADGAAAADTLAVHAASTRPLADNAAAVDALTRAALFVRTIADGAAAADGLLRARGRLASLADGAAAADALVRGALARARSLADGAAAADGLTRLLRQARALADGAAAADVAVSGGVVQPRNLADGAAAVDALTLGVLDTRALADGAAALDVLVGVLNRGRVLDDAAAAADSLAVFLGHRTLADGAAGSDALGHARLLRLLLDGAAAVDTLLVAARHHPRHHVIVATPDDRDGITLVAVPVDRDGITTSATPGHRDGITTSATPGGRDAVTTSTPGDRDSITTTAAARARDGITTAATAADRDGITLVAVPAARHSITTTAAPGGRDGITTTDGPDDRDGITAGDGPDDRRSHTTSYA